MFELCKLQFKFPQKNLLFLLIIQIVKISCRSEIIPAEIIDAIELNLKNPPEETN